VSIEVIRFDEVPATPWKNGLGTTKQLAVFPPDSNASAFEWRVSIAHLRGTAPFSEFPGIERCLAMLEGEVTLLRESQPHVTLTPASTPVTFSGVEKIIGRVESQSALDLNLMYQASCWRASMQRLSLQAGESIRTSALTLLCVCEPVCLKISNDVVDLRLFDTLRLNEPGTDVVALSKVTGYVIELKAFAIDR